ncbi:MAG: arginase [Flavobacteriaceae bacterium CG1_02_35_72]|nr:MAG: arginase [Flavobacteriaceae bacterium CG1_02_35_72]
MWAHYLKPVNQSILAHIVLNSNFSLGQQIKIHTQENGIPKIEGNELAIIGVKEDRNSINNLGTGSDLSQIRKELYQLFPGNWHKKIVDLGNIEKGNEISDTYFALKEIASYLLKKNVILILIGGGNDILYANYRAYDTLEQVVNLVSVDAKFDIGSLDEPLSSETYLYKIIMEKPNILFNFSNIAYQTYFNSKQELDLVNSLFFDAYRLGEVSQNIAIAEPVLRDADIVSIDISAIKYTEAKANKNASPNGLTGVEICAIARYAGLSDKVSSFGVYEYNPKLDTDSQSAKLIAQMIWYFIEGVNFRTKDYPFEKKENYKKYIVPLDEQTINFYKSHKSDRWWMEVTTSNNKRKTTLIPCTYQDYLDACNQNIPERWFKALKKLN